MVDTSGIHSVVRRARRRLRLQAALEAAALSSIVTFAILAADIYLVRRGSIGQPVALGLFALAVFVTVASAIGGAFRSWSTAAVATKIDRASGLSDRLATACEFETRLQSGVEKDAETLELMEAAVRDAVRLAPRANPVSATPFRAPRDTRAALIFAGLTTVIAALYFPETSDALALGPGTPKAPKELAEREREPLAADDVAYSTEILEDLRKTAEDTGDPHLKEFVNEVDALLKQAEKGELGKEELLAKLRDAENKFMQGAGENSEETLADLKRTGEELKKEEATREMGEALAKGDLEKAQKEMEKLADKMNKGELSEKQAAEAAKAMEKAAEAFEKKEQKAKDEMSKQIAKKQEEERRLQKQKDEAKSEKEKEQLTRRLENKKRELEKLNRDKQEREESAQKRRLERMHRNLKKTAEELKDKKDQQSQKLASKTLRDAAEDTGQVDSDMRKQAAQKQVASQLSDLKEAMRRAKQGGARGPKDLFGKNRRQNDFRKRAAGGKGSKQAWKSGQGQKGQGKGQGQGQGQGQQPGGSQPGDKWGDQEGGDPTGALASGTSGDTVDESLQGVQGKGSSTRETILASAQKGFASRSYRDVYARYKAVVEEVINAEKVPSAYKYYVKRYFQNIKPQAPPAAAEPSEAGQP